MPSELEAEHWVRFRAAVADKLGVEQERVCPSAAFVADLGADSLDIVALLMDLEDQFQVAIPEKAAAQLDTVGACFDYVCAELGARGT
jgi:acyl carrier protein